MLTHWIACAASTAIETEFYGEFFMSRHEGLEIAPGAVFEFYESKEILCGVVLSVKDGRFNALSERNREVSLTLSRMVYHGKTSLDLKLGRDELVQKLRSISENRKDDHGPDRSRGNLVPARIRRDRL